ncbi:hypothetical protein EVAR_35315_1 [Eumeta japonica]|uniref:Uncharacterized protein n=1 Tax=Eumeta variegata TaxID=151549 RepID=A0A4C1XMI8_EUMVA|nr:hypothetical protein EVAR_35315_1 [Eumeta japonica]
MSTGARAGRAHGLRRPTFSVTVLDGELHITRERPYDWHYTCLSSPSFLSGRGSAVESTGFEPKGAELDHGRGRIALRRFNSSQINRCPFSLLQNRCRTEYWDLRYELAEKRPSLESKLKLACRNFGMFNRMRKCPEPDRALHFIKRMKGGCISTTVLPLNRTQRRAFRIGGFRERFNIFVHALSNIL